MSKNYGREKVPEHARETYKVQSARETYQVQAVAPMDSRPPGDDDTSVVRNPTMANRVLDADGAQKIPCLVAVSGLDMGSVVSVPEEGLIVGRGQDCTLVLRDDGVSRNHVRLEVRDRGDLFVRDLSSTNGTFVNGRRVEVDIMRPGDKIIVGRGTAFKYLLQDEVDLKYQQEMFESTTRDGLTGLFNRQYLMQKLVSDLSFARRHKLPFTFLMFDIDFFKRVNDTYGHQVGDRVLVNVAKVVETMCRTEDVVGRYGGEEFAVIAQGTPYDGARALGERLRSRVENEPMLALDEAGRPVRVTISVGVATVPPGDQVDVSEVISVADGNLYRAKESGRNRTVASLIT